MLKQNICLSPIKHYLLTASNYNIFEMIAYKYLIKQSRLVLFSKLNMIYVFTTANIIKIYTLV